MTTVGFELEVSRGALQVAALLHQDGRIHNARHHHYHCRCETCAFDNYGPDGRVLFSMQEDCTANGEFISKVLEYGPQVGEAADVLSRALIRAGAQVQGTVGLHVHVNRESRDHATDARVLRLFVRYQEDLREIAEGSRREVRDYNRPLETDAYRGALWQHAPEDFPVEVPATEHRYGYNIEPAHLLDGSWLAWDNRTYEFRLWNAPLAAWRIRLAVGLSHAIVMAAQDGVTVERQDHRTLEEVLAPYMDDDTWAGVLVQRRFKGGVEQ